MFSEVNIFLKQLSANFNSAVVDFLLLFPPSKKEIESIQKKIEEEKEINRQEDAEMAKINEYFMSMVIESRRKNKNIAATEDKLPKKENLPDWFYKINLN